ncbi:MAG: hypothetical protein FWG98_10665 [Candidatus Cloacimonetes bacterium]|nr:hypothetical protein [Candidatus Cloacimonadota bacterium]
MSELKNNESVFAMTSVNSWTFEENIIMSQSFNNDNTIDSLIFNDCETVSTATSTSSNYQRIFHNVILKKKAKVFWRLNDK